MSGAARDPADRAPPAGPADARPIVAAIGAFDGVHLGHQALLRDLVASATALGARSVCVTFEPDPERVLRPHLPARALAPAAERTRLVHDLGVDEVYVWEFTQAVARMSPEDFVSALCARYALVEVWVGADFRFARARSGTVDTLAELGRRHGFAVKCRAPVFAGDQAISSTRIRDLLGAGDADEARRLLGRPYRISGEVIAGAQRGQQLGFPTANLLPPQGQALPGFGVYAGMATVRNGTYPAVANVGTRPTFGEDQPLIEVHLLDFAGDLYGQHLALDLVSRVRTIRKFQSLGALRAQIAADVVAARAALTQVP